MCPEEVDRIAVITCIEKTMNLRRHLGVPFIYGRVTSNLFSPMIERLDNMLDGWKTKFLSLAGRQVLAQTTLSSIPYYIMQSTLLPVDICDYIDKKIRSFIWGSSHSERKCHLVSWSKVTKAKDEGGLGIRTSQAMNMAFMGKLVWRMIKEKDRMWDKIIANKYRWNNGEVGNIKPKRGATNLCQGITKALPTIQQGFKYKVRNGWRTNFWKDIWLGNKPLEELCTGNNEERVGDTRVVDFWDKELGWKWNELHNIGSEEIRRKLELTILEDDEQAEDELYWSEEAACTYVVTLAYNLILNDPNEVHEGPWGELWTQRVPNKMKTFLWLVIHGRILSNNERFRRGLTVDDRCPCCRAEVETIKHTIRGCKHVEVVWRRITPPVEFHQHRRLEFQDWLSRNLRGQMVRHVNKE